MFSLSKVSPSITNQIRFDHSHVLVTFHQYTTSTRNTAKQALAGAICDALEIHATLEEEILYPVLHRLHPANPLVLKIEPETEQILLRIARLRAMPVDDARHDVMVYELMRDVMHHVADEETQLLPEVDRLLGKKHLKQLGAAMVKRRLELLKPKAGKIATETMVGFSGSTTAIAATVAGAVIAAGLLAKRSPDARAAPLT